MFPSYLLWLLQGCRVVRLLWLGLAEWLREGNEHASPAVPARPASGDHGRASRIERESKQAAGKPEPSPAFHLWDSIEGLANWLRREVQAGLSPADSDRSRETLAPQRKASARSKGRPAAAAAWLVWLAALVLAVAELGLFSRLLLLAVLSGGLLWLVRGLEGGGEDT